MEPEIFKECVICGCIVVRSQGIHLLHHFICNDCEREIVRTDVEDDQYRYFVKRLHTLLLDFSIEQVAP